MFKYVLAWIPMVFIAIASGAMREEWYDKHLSALHAHQVSTGLGVLLLGIYIWVLLRFWSPTSSGQAITIGLVWPACIAQIQKTMDIRRDANRKYTAPSRALLNRETLCSTFKLDARITPPTRPFA
jgi:hypothetical protein